MKHNHTPGPWIFAYGSVYQGDDANTVEKHIGRIASADRDNPHTKPTERDANCRLIAAAPDLLDAAFKALSILAMANCPDGTTATSKEAFEAVLSAIAKATD